MALGIVTVALAPLLACVGATPSSDSVLLVQQHIHNHSELADPNAALIKELELISKNPNGTGAPGGFASRANGILFMGLLSGMSFEKIMMDMVYPHFRQEPKTDLEMGDCDQSERFGLWRGALRLSALVQLLGFEGTMRQLPSQCSENMIQIPDRSLDPEEGAAVVQPLLNMASMSDCLSKTFMINKQCAMCQAKFMQMSETCAPNCAGMRNYCSWASYGSKPCMISAAKCMNCGMPPWREHFQCLGGMPKADLDMFFSFLSSWVDLMSDESVLNHQMIGDVVRTALDKAWSARKGQGEQQRKVHMSHKFAWHKKGHKIGTKTVGQHNKTDEVLASNNSQGQ